MDDRLVLNLSKSRQCEYLANIYKEHILNSFLDEVVQQLFPEIGDTLKHLESLELFEPQQLLPNEIILDYFTKVKRHMGAKRLQRMRSQNQKKIWVAQVGQSSIEVAVT